MLGDEKSWGFKSQLIAIFVLIVFVVVIFVTSGSHLPAMYEGSGNGFELAASIFQQQSSSPWTLLHHMALYVVIPFLMVFTLIFGVLEGSAGAYLSKKVWNVLALLLSFSVMLSGWFVTLAELVGGASTVLITVLIVYLIALIFFDATMRTSAIGRERMRRFLEDEDLMAKAHEVDERLTELHTKVSDSSNRTKSRIVGLCDSAIKTDINDVEYLEELSNKAEEAVEGGGRTKEGESIASLIRQKHQLAKSFQKHQRKEIKEERDQL